MAHGRILSKDIGDDKAVHELSSDTCRLAFSWAISHLDRDGRMAGDPAVVKSKVFPRREDISVEQMRGFIQEWAAKKLVLWYEAAGDRWLFFPAFRKHQPNLPYGKEAPSRIPPPTEAHLQQLQTDSGVGLEEVQPNGTEEKRREENSGGGSAPPAPPRAKPEKEAKIEYAENVLLTREQYQKLVDRWGSDWVSRATEKLSTYKLSTGKRYKSDYHTLKNWVFAAIGAKPKPGPAGWPCPHCGHRNTHNGSFCLRCRKDRDDKPGGQES